jgi:hypothetical protein
MAVITEELNVSKCYDSEPTDSHFFFQRHRYGVAGKCALFCTMCVGLKRDTYITGKKFFGFFLDCFPLALAVGVKRRRSTKLR